MVVPTSRGGRGRRVADHQTKIVLVNERNGGMGAWHVKKLVVLRLGPKIKTCRFALGPKNVHQPWALAPLSGKVLGN